MSQENVEVVRQMYGAFQQGDPARTFDFYDSDAELDATRVAGITPDQAGIYRGHAAIRSFWGQWLSAWRDLRFEIQELRDAGDEVVVLVRNQHQWGRHSGIETEVPPYGVVVTIRGGKIVRWVFYPDHETALEAVGLRE